MRKQSPSDFDEFGRPQSLAVRLVAYTAILSQANLTSSRSNLMNLSFWDEAISPVIGCEIETIGFTRMANEVWSDRMSETLRRAIGESMLLADADKHGESDPALYPSQSLVDAAVEMTGTAWFEVLSSFVSGFTRDEKNSDGIGPLTETHDIKLMMSLDPVFLSMSESGIWDSGPAMAEVDFSAVDKSFSGKVQNLAVGLILKWMIAQSDGESTARDLISAVETYGRFLVSRAAKESRRFGENDYIENLRRIRARVSGKKVSGSTFVTTEFLDGDQVVASCEVQLGWRDLSESGDGARTRGHDGTLHFLEVKPGFEGRGFATLVLRHAIAQGARLAPVPRDNRLYKIMLNYGHLTPQGDMIRFCDVQWPECLMVNEDQEEVEAA